MGVGTQPPAPASTRHGVDGGDIKLPLTERVATQLAPGQWVSISLSNIVGMQGIVLLVYVSALMFVMGRSSIKPRSKPREASRIWRNFRAMPCRR